MQIALNQNLLNQLVFLRYKFNLLIFRFNFQLTSVHNP